MEVGLGPGDFVFDGDPTTSRKRAHLLHPIFGQCLLWPNGWIDQDATLYGGKVGAGDVMLDGVAAMAAIGSGIWGTPAGRPSRWALAQYFMFLTHDYLCSASLCLLFIFVVITFRVSRRRREMYCGHPRLCVCLSVCLCVCLSVCLQPHAHTIARTRM